MKDYLINLVSQVHGNAAKAHIMREYLQVYALRAIFEKGRFSQITFVGGTALRFVFGLPRFSEDLDFSLTNPDGYDFIEMISEIKRSFEDANYTVSIKHKTERTVNSAMLRFPELMFLAGLTHLKEQNLSIKLEVDTKPPKGGKVVRSLVNKYFPVTFAHYDLSSLFAGKLHAIFTRQYIKGRDYFDLVWLLSKERNLNPNIDLLNAALEQTGNKLRITLNNWRDKVFERIQSADWSKIVEDADKFAEDPLFMNSMKLEYARALLIK